MQHPGNLVFKIVTSNWNDLNMTKLDTVSAEGTWKSIPSGNRQESEKEGCIPWSEGCAKKGCGLSHVKLLKSKGNILLASCYIGHGKGLANKILKNPSESYLICFHITDILFIYQRLRHCGQMTASKDILKYSILHHFPQDLFRIKLSVRREICFKKKKEGERHPFD